MWYQIEQIIDHHQLGEHFYFILALTRFVVDLSNMLFVDLLQLLNNTIYFRLEIVHLYTKRLFIMGFHIYTLKVNESCEIKAISFLKLNDIRQYSSSNM